MTTSAIGSAPNLMIQSLVSMRNQFNDLERQLSTGQKSDNYAGLGLSAGLSVNLNQQLSAIGSFDASMTTAQTQIDIASQALTSVGSVGDSVRSLIEQASSNSTNFATVQSNAQASLQQLLGMLNTQAGDRYVFSGLATNTPSVDTYDHIVNGDGARAGLTQIISERNQADLGASGLGRLAITNPTATSVDVAEDAVSPFGFKLASVGGNLTNASVVQTAGPPADISVDFAGGQPNDGDALSLQLTLPDGSSETVNLTATTNSPPGAKQFTIGATTTDTANNFTAALTGALSDLASTSLKAASTVTASNDFFAADASNPPPRVAGPPFDTSTALRTGTAAETVIWYTGEAASSDGSRAGLTQLISERNQADLGAGGMGRLTVSSPGPGSVALTEDAGPFGLKLSGVTNGLTNASVTGPAGSPASLQVDLAGQPNDGDIIKFDFALPDGSTQTITLAATTASPAGAGQFSIGANPAATASNLQSALSGSISALASGALTTASTVKATNDFYAADANHPPPRVDGPPFDTATALRPGTASDTVIWSSRVAGNSARSTATARIDPALVVSYGTRANEDGIRSIVQNVATLAAVQQATGSSATDFNAALSSRIVSGLSGSPGTQSITDIASDLAGAETSMQTMKAQHQQTSATLTDLLQQINGVSNEQVGAQILTLQTQMQASMQTTAMLLQTSLVNYLGTGG